MKYLNLRNRIAFTYIAVTALLIATLFSLIYIVIFNTVYSHLDSDLDAETQEVYSSIVVLDNVIVFSNPTEWTEKEHEQIEVNPTFIEIVDTTGTIIKRTPNLRQGALYFNPKKKSVKSYYDTLLSGSPIRQLQVPIQNPTGKILAHLIIAIPLQESAIVLKNLRQTLLIGYPIVLIVLFLISRFIAGRSIAPINAVISTAEKITKENLNERIALPYNKDEIYTLSETVNDLLDRLKDVVLREKQFTADASHELRTPLSVIKGTLEVLIRKPREREQYVEKINYVLNEVDRMSLLVDQLLELARFESGTIKPTITPFNLKELVEGVFTRLLLASSEKNISFHIAASDASDDCTVSADISMTTIIIENILSNAIKYSYDDQSINVMIAKSSGTILCSITNHGSGIPEDQIGKIFDRFYRADESRTAQIPGKGIGLAIVKRLAEIQHLGISVQSTPASGTSFTIVFP